MSRALPSASPSTAPGRRQAPRASERAVDQRVERPLSTVMQSAGERPATNDDFERLFGGLPGDGEG